MAVFSLDHIVERFLVAFGVRSSWAHLHARQVLKFGLAGVFNTTLDLSLLTAFVELLSLPVPLSVALAGLIAVTSAFFINKHWTFHDANGSHLAQYVQFWLVYGSNIPLAVLITWVLTDVLGLWYLLARITAIPLCACWNYGWLHCRVFRR
jgi:putative flippase GtrA